MFCENITIDPEFIRTFWIHHIYVMTPTAPTPGHPDIGGYQSSALVEAIGTNAKAGGHSHSRISNLSRGHRCWYLPASSSSPVIGHRQRVKCSVPPPEFTPHLAVCDFPCFPFDFPFFFHRFIPLPEFAQVHEFVVFRNLCFLVYLPVRGGGGCAGIVLWVDPVRWPSGVVPGRGNSMCNWEFISRQRLIYISSCGDGVGGIAGRSAGEQDTGWSIGRCCNY